jgi:hypothetical protein
MIIFSFKLKRFIIPGSENEATNKKILVIKYIIAIIIGRITVTFFERNFDSKKKNKITGTLIAKNVINVGLNAHGPEIIEPLKGKKLSPSHF